MFAVLYFVRVILQIRYSASGKYIYTSSKREIKDTEICKCFMSFRISSHKLEIERGRYKKFYVKDKVCNTGAVEVEQH